MTHKKIATLVLEHIKTGVRKNEVGELTPLRGGVYRVTCDQKTVLVWLSGDGYWCVSFCGVTCVHLDLAEATRMALLNTDPVTKNYPV